MKNTDGSWGNVINTSIIGIHQVALFYLVLLSGCLVSVDKQADAVITARS